MDIDATRDLEWYRREHAQKREENSWQSKQITAWLAGPPSLGNDPALLMSLIDDLVELFRGYEVRTVHSGEPRKYRLTEKGRAHLLAMLTERRTDIVQVSSETGPGLFDAPALGVAMSLVHLRSHWGESEDAVTVGLSCSRRTGSLSEVLPHVVGFVKRWFPRLPAASAFVSWTDRYGGRRHGDGAGGIGPTTHEDATGQPAFFRWPAHEHYLRGTFWGNALGAALCERLGGRERVLREAPVALAEPLGDGVWLQLAGEPPPDENELLRLAEYLRPLLTWTNEDLEAITPRPPSQPADPAPPPVPQGTTPVPVDLSSDLEGTVALNVHLTHQPSGEEVALVAAAVRAWRHDASEGCIGGEDFHYVSEPAVDWGDNVVRWSADLGHADTTQAIRQLALRLGTFQQELVEYLSVGEQNTG